MFAKRLLQKVADHHRHFQPEMQQGSLKPTDCDIRVISHYGVPSTASVLAVDPIQQLIAIGTLDGRIKVIGGNNIECLLISPKQLPYKKLEFLQNQGFLIGISMDNEIQVCNLENQSIDSCLQWKSNITVFSVIFGSQFMLVVDEHGQISVLKCDIEGGKLLHMPYNISSKFLAEKSGFSFAVNQPIVGALPQPCSFGSRLLVAYENGLIILWDIIEAQVVCIRGDKDLEMKVQVSDFPSKAGVDPSDNAIQKLDEKEVTALCWASSNGQVLAVGYIDGDIMLWDIPNNTSSKRHHFGPSNNKVVHLQLSSAEKRLPVIVLHWAVSSLSRDSDDGQLFIYGGGEIGSEEVLTVVNLQWSSGMDRLQYVHRVDLSLVGSFSDMVLMSPPGATDFVNNCGLFVLTSPGNLQFYDEKILSSLASQQERRPSIPAIELPTAVPISKPQITAAKLCWFPSNIDLSEIASAGSTLSSDEDRKWPLNGGVPSSIPSDKAKRAEGVYITGHQDGSVRICNASYPVLSLMSVLESKVHGVELDGLSSSVTKLDISVATMNLAVGNECGLVRLYNLKNDAEKTNLCVITNSKHQVYEVSQEKGLHCRAVIHLVNASIVSLQFSERGDKLAVGYESNHVAVLDMNSFSILFLVDSISGSHCPVISVIWRTFKNSNGLVKSQKLSESGIPENSKEELMFTLNRDGKINIIDGNTGNTVSSQPMHLKKELTAISMHVIESGYPAPVVSKDTQPQQLDEDAVTGNDAIQDEPPSMAVTLGPELHSSSGERLLDSLVLICCEDSLRLYHMKSVFQGEDKPVHKVKLLKRCCWTSTFEKDGVICGLALLYESGDLEIRSLPDLGIVVEGSLMSILRWNFRPKMQKIISSTDNGLIIMVNGSELAVISLPSGKDYLRIIEYLPCLHDTVLAAAADAAITSSLNQKRQAGSAGILGDMLKGFKKEKLIQKTDHSSATQCITAHLDYIFSKAPIDNKSTTSAENKDVEELSIDDIEIDEPVPIASTASYQHASEGKVKGNRSGTERERLLEDASLDTKPRMRTPEEIKAKYRKAGGASSEAKEARNKLMERGEKLQRLTEKTEDLRSGAEDFASMANELVKTMEARKRWPF